MTESNERDFTRSAWGHNLNITSWDSARGTGRGVCWITPPLREGDTVRVPSKLGSMLLRVHNVKWEYGVDDMYSFDLAAEGSE
jgi:hypothetical protein